MMEYRRLGSRRQNMIDIGIISPGEDTGISYPILQEVHRPEDLPVSALADPSVLPVAEESMDKDNARADALEQCYAIIG